jgi:hypothetical protein
MEEKGRYFEWEALEYPHREHTVDWYWGLGVSSIVLAGISIYMSNTLFAILVIAGSLAIGIMAMRTPRAEKYLVGEKAISIGDKKLWYSDIESFYISERENGVKLIIAGKHLFSTYIVIPVHDHDPDVLRAFLLRRLPEVHHEEPILNIIVERLGL